MTLSMWMILIFCLFGFYIAIYLDKKWSIAIPETYDQNTSDMVADYMTTLLTELADQIFIYKPIDVRSVRHDPKKVGNNWVYRTKATIHRNGFYKVGLAREFATLINRRAEDVQLPIRVTAIYPQGPFFIYDIQIVGNLFQG
jgi:hypothetical protein